MDRHTGVDDFGEPTYANETITPEMARQYHEMYQRNRPIRKKKVAEYANAMSENGWLLTGEGIVFDWNGMPVNGDHRFLASMASGIPFRTLVVRGVDPEAFKVIDSTASRMFRDDLVILGITSASQTGGMVRKIAYWNLIAGRDAETRGVNAEDGHGGLAGLHKFSVARTDLHAMYPQYAKEIAETIAACRKYEADFPGDRGAMLFMHWLLVREGNNPEVIDRFFTILCSGSEDRRNHTVLLRLREVLGGRTSRYLQEKMGNRPVQEHHVYWMLSNWNRWVKMSTIPTFIMRGPGGTLSNPYPQPQRVR